MLYVAYLEFCNGLALAAVKWGMSSLTLLMTFWLTLGERLLVSPCLIFSILEVPVSFDCYNVWLILDGLAAWGISIFICFWFGECRICFFGIVTPCLALGFCRFLFGMAGCLWDEPADLLPIERFMGELLWLSWSASKSCSLITYKSMWSRPNLFDFFCLNFDKCAILPFWLPLFCGASSTA